MNPFEPFFAKLPQEVVNAFYEVEKTNQYYLLVSQALVNAIRDQSEERIAAAQKHSVQARVQHEQAKISLYLVISKYRNRTDPVLQKMRRELGSGSLRVVVEDHVADFAQYIKKLEGDAAADPLVEMSEKILVMSSGVNSGVEQVDKAAVTLNDELRTAVHAFEEARKRVDSARQALKEIEQVNPTLIDGVAIESLKDECLHADLKYKQALLRLLFTAIKNQENLTSIFTSDEMDYIQMFMS